MKTVAQLLNAMRAAGVIQEYALFGAVAQMRYTEAVATLDADVLVMVPAPDRLVLAGIYQFCADKGYHPEGEAIAVGGWPCWNRKVLRPSRSGDWLRGTVWPRSGERLKRGFSMDEVQQLLERQARWQKARKNLSWPEKVRMAEMVRESTRQWRARASDLARHRSDPGRQAAQSQGPHS